MRVEPQHGAGLQRTVPSTCRDTCAERRPAPPSPPPRPRSSARCRASRAGAPAPGSPAPPPAAAAPPAATAPALTAPPAAPGAPAGCLAGCAPGCRRRRRSQACPPRAMPPACCTRRAARRAAPTPQRPTVPATAASSRCGRRRSPAQPSTCKQQWLLSAWLGRVHRLRHPLHARHPQMPCLDVCVRPRGRQGAPDSRLPVPPPAPCGHCNPAPTSAALPSLPCSWTPSWSQRRRRGPARCLRRSSGCFCWARPPSLCGCCCSRGPRWGHRGSRRSMPGRLGHRLESRRVAREALWRRGNGCRPDCPF